MLPRLSEFLHWAKTCSGEQNDIFEVRLFLNSRCYPSYSSTSVSVSIRHFVRLLRIVRQIFFRSLFPSCSRLLDHCSPILRFAPMPRFASYGSSFCPAPLFVCCPLDHACPYREVSVPCLKGVAIVNIVGKVAFYPPELSQSIPQATVMTVQMYQKK
jgi:hypothetical protein